MPLAKRIIPTLLNKGGALVKGRGFSHSRIIGHTLQAVRVYQSRDVDELIYLDVAATTENRGPDVELVRDMAGECFMPLTVGGGVATLDHFRALLENGADKVAINSAAVETPELITEAAKRFGAQAVVVSVDVKNSTVHTRSGKLDTGLDPIVWAIEAQERGAGEILLNRIECDGTMLGYDLGLIERVSSAVSVPVVAAGGAGSYEHLRQGLAHGAHAVAAGAMWSFTDSTPAEAAEYLAGSGFPVRRKLAA